MNIVLSVLQLIIAVALSSLILLQPKGTGMGRSFASTSYHSRRGVETLIFRTTITLAALFVVLSVVNQLFI